MAVAVPPFCLTKLVKQKSRTITAEKHGQCLKSTSCSEMK